jgi:hypothetical protein
LNVIAPAGNEVEESAQPLAAEIVTFSTLGLLEAGELALGVALLLDDPPQPARTTALTAPSAESARNLDVVRVACGGCTGRSPQVG